MAALRLVLCPTLASSSIKACLRWQYFLMILMIKMVCSCENYSINHQCSSLQGWSNVQHLERPESTDKIEQGRGFPWHRKGCSTHSSSITKISIIMINNPFLMITIATTRLTNGCAVLHFPPWSSPEFHDFMMISIPLLIITITITIIMITTITITRSTNGCAQCGLASSSRSTRRFTSLLDSRIFWSVIMLIKRIFWSIIMLIKECVGL